MSNVFICHPRRYQHILSRIENRGARKRVNNKATFRKDYMNRKEDYYEKLDQGSTRIRIA